ncbi:hypothetical protein JCM15457_1088 [Liquorilactobacillus sucicola DSM 21376 = JCM 15457]|nr:hypothetical protein JCM15457_1088 [Liquorilactobacillus sucicola DSM 21376 = JCM 15457]
MEAGRNIDSVEFGEKITETTQAVFGVQAELSKLKKTLDQKNIQRTTIDKKK